MHIFLFLIGILFSKSKYPTYSLKKFLFFLLFTIFLFNFSLIGNEDALSVYELHIAVKDHCFGFGREDRLVGVAVMQLKDIEDQVSYKVKMILGDCLDSIPSPSPTVKIQIMRGKVG